MAKWLEGRYSTYYLKLGNGLDCTVSYSTSRGRRGDEEFPWLARIFGNDIGGAKTLEAAKENVERLAADMLNNALKKLSPER